MAEGLCIDTAPICLADGRRLLPGAKATRIDLAHPENRALVDDERLLIIDRPRRSRARRKED